jgi:hypothetical protein
MGMGQVPTRMGMRRVEVLDAFTKVDCSDQETVNGATLSGPHTGTTAGYRSNIFEMRKIDSSAPWGVPGATALAAVWFQECGVPVLVSLEVPAKSFVLRRCSNFIFPAPISCLGICRLR